MIIFPISFFFLHAVTMYLFQTDSITESRSDSQHLDRSHAKHTQHDSEAAAPPSSWHLGCRESR